ncbi:MAG: NAD(+) synthase [Ruminococcaceae bacterium]|nr:NAD(+) synthase [Oscillospiraceae bacterium]
MKHGFIKLASAVPEILVAAPTKNVSSITELIDQAYEAGASVVVFPELSITGYTAADLFMTDSLIINAERALTEIVEHTKGKKILSFVGVPVKNNGKLYNCAAAISDGEILGVVPKTNIPNYSEFYEMRYFAPAPKCNSTVKLCGKAVPFGTKMIFECDEMPSLKVACEISEDMWAANSPSIAHTSAGATVIANLAASSEIVSKEDYRRMLVSSASAKQVCAYIYADAGESESTTDLVFSGHSIIASNGRITAEKLPFDDEKLVFGTVDLFHNEHDRLKMNTWGTSDVSEYLRIPFSIDVREVDIRDIADPAPFIPKGEEERKKVFARILDIQAKGLSKRIKAAYAKGCVIALSGGLDSTLALIAAVRAIDLLGRDRSEILSVTMPCFGTTGRTRSNAEKLAAEFGTSFRCIDIKEAVDLHFRDIGHDPDDLSVVYENSQARERTQIIMDIANADGSLVIGTGDLSELALGWATYNGDHMSNYGVNGSIPKTLVRHIVSYYADCCDAEGKHSLAEVLRDILATPVSPELLPAKDGEISQKTEDIVGPYDLHDFFLYHFVRWGETPDKIFREAKAAFGDRFDDETIKKWLNTFMRRFYSQQFKRSALPDGPKVGTVSLSPRGDWKMPSDACGWEMQI